MKILMVRPKPESDTIGLQHLMVVEPLELEILYTLKRDQDAAVIVDMILEEDPFRSFLSEHNPDVLCLTGYITNVETITSYCKSAKDFNEQVVTIVGGVHCEVCPEDFVHPAIDFRVVRNASSNFTELLNCIDNGHDPPAGVLKRNQNIQDIVLPDFDFSIPLANRAAVDRYRRKYFYIFHDKVALIKTSFGCPYSCSFCFCRVITDGKFSQREIADVIHELEQIKETEIYIVDDDFLYDRKWLREFISEVKRNRIIKNYLVYGRADFIANNPDLMKELAEIGLRTVIVGFESFNDDELTRYNKNSSSNIYKKTMKVLHQQRIEVFATIILSPDWGKTDFRKMVEVIKSLKIHFVNLQPLTPLPKTGLSIPENQIIIDKQDFSSWDLAHISVQPTKLSVPEYYSEILKSYNSIVYNPKAIIKYLVHYKLTMLFKMIIGSYRVARQYKKKIKEAKDNA